MVFSKNHNILPIIHNVCRFFVEESCGICVPCRTGNYLLNKKLDKIIAGNANRKDLQEIRQWSRIIRANSRCGLGMMSSNALIDTLDKFPKVFEDNLLTNNGFDKSFNLEKATSEYDKIITEITSDYE